MAGVNYLCTSIFSDLKLEEIIFPFTIKHHIYSYGFNVYVEISPS
jgi:hypothetical protein